MSAAVHLTREQLEAGLEAIRLSPPDRGVLKMIVRRPRVGERETLREGQLDLVQGLLGDSWIRRGSSRSPDGGPHPDMQLNVMNARAVALIAREESRWALAGDQLYVDLDPRSIARQLDGWKHQTSAPMTMRPGPAPAARGAIRSVSSPRW